jgi:hypothetical protein
MFLMPALHGLISSRAGNPKASTADDRHFCAIEQWRSEEDDQTLRDFASADAGADRVGRPAVTAP